MAVIRVHKTADYTVMSNSHFREYGLSYKAKGILSQMLSLPDNWDYSVAGMATLATDGKDSVMSGLAELEKFGYLKRTRTFDEKGRFTGYDYDIYETPQIEKPCTENPNTVDTNTDKPYSENPQQLNNNQSITNISNTNDKKKESKQATFNDLFIEYAKTLDVSERAEVVDLLIEWLKVRKAKRAAMTDRAIELNLQKLNNLANESGMSVADYLKEVICRGWQAFYPINNFNAPAPNQTSRIMDDFNRMNERIENGKLF